MADEAARAQAIATLNTFEQDWRLIGGNPPDMDMVYNSSAAAALDILEIPFTQADYTGEEMGEAFSPQTDRIIIGEDEMRQMAGLGIRFPDHQRYMPEAGATLSADTLKGLSGPDEIKRD